MREFLASIGYMFGYDLVAISLAIGLRQCVLDRDLVLVLWYRVQERLK